MESFAHRGAHCQIDKINARRKKFNAPSVRSGNPQSVAKFGSRARPSLFRGEAPKERRPIGLTFSARCSLVSLTIAVANFRVEKSARHRYTATMFNAEQIRALLTAREFRPFRVCLSGGASYEITNHDMALVGRNSVEIGVNPAPNGIAERFVRCAIIHIARIEDLQAA